MRTFVFLAACLIALASPASAGDDVATAQSIIRSQAEAFGRDDAAAAYSYAAPAIRGMFPQADIFMSMVRNSYAPVYRHRSFEFGEARVSDGQIAQQRFTSSTPTAAHGKRCIRWSFNPTAA
jgi:hypothetical protein